MSGIRAKNTKPELVLRRGLHRRGLRFRLHSSVVPGKPDLIFPKYNAALFAHGCFWHHHNCRLFKWPSSRKEFWRSKIARNVERDREVRAELETTGWRVGIVWECALKGRASLPLEVVLDSCEHWLLSDEADLEIRGDEVRLSV